MNATMEYVIGALGDLGFVVALQGLSIQRMRGDADNGLSASVLVGDDESIEFGLTQRTDGSASNVLHCVVDTEMGQAWLSSDFYAELNGEWDIDGRGTSSLQKVFKRLQEFLLVRREPLQLKQIIDGLVCCLESEMSRSLMATVFKRFGLEWVYISPLQASTKDTAKNTSKPAVALHDLDVLARYARDEMITSGQDLCRIALDDSSELLIFPPEARATMYTVARVPVSQETAGKGL